jgi:hypothetical protein
MENSLSLLIFNVLRECEFILTIAFHVQVYALYLPIRALNFGHASPN